MVKVLKDYSNKFFRKLLHDATKGKSIHFLKQNLYRQYRKVDSVSFQYVKNYEIENFEYPARN